MVARRVRFDLTSPTRRALLGGVAAGLACPAFAAPAPDGDWTRFDDSDGLIRFQGAVNGHPASLTLDSGAGRVVIDQGFARAIGLKTVDDSGILHGVAESRPGGLSEPVVIRVGAGDLRLPNAVLADLSAVKAGGFDVPALIGRDIFELAAVDIDFVGKRLSFRQPGSFDTSAFRRVRMRGRRDVRQIEVSVEGRAPVWAMLDLGSGSSLTMSKAYAASVGLFDGRRTSAWASMGIDGMTTYDVARASRVDLAGVGLRDVKFDAYAVWNRAATAPVNVGYPLMRRLGRVIIDYGSDTLFVANRIPPAEPFAGDRIGLALSPLKPGYQVAFVAPGSPADKDGWKAGDVIAAINGSSTMSIAQRSGLAAASRITYTMADGSMRELRPAPYY